MWCIHGVERYNPVLWQGSKACGFAASPYTTNLRCSFQLSACALGNCNPVLCYTVEVSTCFINITNYVDAVCLFNQQGQELTSANQSLGGAQTRQANWNGCTGRWSSNFLSCCWYLLAFMNHATIFPKKQYRGQNIGRRHTPLDSNAMQRLQWDQIKAPGLLHLSGVTLGLPGCSRHKLGVAWCCCTFLQKIRNGSIIYCILSKEV